MRYEGDQAELLQLALDWKAGRLGRIHPSVGQRLNAALAHAREVPVPFVTATDVGAPSLAELVRREHQR